MTPNPTPISPVTGGKILSRDMSRLRGLSVRNRKNYIRLSASSDAKGRFYRQTLGLDVDDVGIKALAKKGLVVLYKHAGQDVGCIPGGVSFARFDYSPISTSPPKPPPMPSKEWLFLHRDHRLLYHGIGSLDAVVLHALINLSDYDGRGELCFATLHEIIGPCKNEDDSRVTRDRLKESVARLEEMGRLKTYEVKGRAYYAALDAKQWAMKFLPRSKYPPPTGEKWDYSYDSPEGLQWHEQRKETRKAGAEKRKKKSGVPRGAIDRALQGTATKEDLDMLFSKKPHKKFNPERSNAILFAASVLTGKSNCRVSELIEILRLAATRNNQVEFAWFAENTGKSLVDTIDEKLAAFKAKMGADYMVNQEKQTPADVDQSSNPQNHRSKSQLPKPFKTGITTFDQKFASLAHGGDSWLVLGPSGAGKSIFVCQTAGFTATQQKVVAFITTDSSEADIMLKMYSAVHSIPFQELKAMQGAGADAPHAAEFKKWFDENKGFVFVRKYKKLQNFNFILLYGGILEHTHAESGKYPDLVIVDNLQGVLPQNCENHEQKRDFCKAVAETVATTARHMNHVAILVAQGNSNCTSSDRFSAKDTADAGLLSDYMSGALGITMLEEIDRDKTTITRERQNLMVFNSPTGEALHLAFDRRFERSLLANI